MRRSFARPFAAVLTVSFGATVGASLGACAHSSAVAPAPAAAPVPVAVPAAVMPLPARISIARDVPERSYAVRSSATIERDSAGRTDTQRIDTRATVLLRVMRSDDGALRGSGRVDAFSVQLSGAGVVAALPTASTAPATSAASAAASRKTVPVGFTPLNFDAALDATSLRVTARPPLINECDRTESGATTLVHDLLLRLPASTVLGATWRDSTNSVLCRVGIPITVRAVHDYAVLAVDGTGAGTTIRIKRTTATRLDGKVGTAWRTLELTGTGTGTDDVRVDVTTGVLQTVDGQYVLTLQLSERGRSGAPKSQRVVQKTTLHAETPR